MTAFICPASISSVRNFKSSLWSFGDPSSTDRYFPFGVSAFGRTPLTGGRKSGVVGKRAHRSVICDYENTNRTDGCVPGILPEPGLHGKRKNRRGQCCQPWEGASALSL